MMTAQPSELEIVIRKHEEIENPLSVDEIERRLYLGNVTTATNINFLKTKNITHILSIDSCPLPAYVISSTGVLNKYIHISDMPKENLLEYFEECIQFITDGLEGSGAVLVHCFYGVSRSATIVIAYLMKKYSISYQRAFEKAKSKRKLLQPNHGFIQQLKMFHKMGFKIDPEYKSYKIFRLKLAAEQVKSAKILPSNFMNLVKPDPGLMQANPETNVFRCRKCRRVVANNTNLITHKSMDQNLSYDSPVAIKKEKFQPAEHFLTTLHQEQLNANSEPDAIVGLAQQVLKTSLSDKSLSEKEREPPICTKTYFVEPLAWMKDVLKDAQGKLFCPKCQSKLGSFNWVMASRCPCGAQVSPSFYLVPSKVEPSNIVQNIMQVTV